MALTQISTAGIKDDAVTSGKIPANAVGSSELADNAVDTAAIADDAVNNNKIANSAVNTAQLADNAVHTQKINDDAVTTDKLANSIVNDINANTAKVQTTINNNADNRVITGSGTANTLEGESVLTFDSSTDTLQVHQQNSGNNPALKVIHRGGANSNISTHFQTYGGTNDVVITHGGNIGIGTTNPTSPDGSNADNSLNGPVLTVYGDSPAINLTSSTTGTDDYSLINFGRTGSSSNPYRAVIAYKQSDDILRINAQNHIAFDVGSNLGSNELIRLDGTGKVGIGTTSPSGKLHVNSGKLRVDGGATARTLDVETTHSSGGEIASFQNNANNAYGGLVISGGEIDRETRLEAAWGSGFFTFWCDNAERMRIDSSGKLMVGGTTADAKFAVIDSSNPDIALRYNGTTGGHQTRTMFMDKRGVINAQVANYLHDDGVGTAAAALDFWTSHAGTLSRRMVILRDGNIHMGDSVSVSGLANSRGFIFETSGTQQIKVSTTGGKNVMEFSNPNGNVGRITTSGSSTAFHTSSDYRLKENETTISDGITRLKTLIPRRFKWKADPTNTFEDGFFAHEVTAVPEAISGVKDETYTEDNLVKGISKGDPLYQMIDQSKLVPLLTAALKEAITKIETLETKVAALEAA